MKQKRSLWQRLTSGLLSLLLVVTSIPLTAVTAFGVSVNASIEDYKYNKLWGLTNDRPMAYATSTQGPRQSILSSPVAAAGYTDAETDWMYFAFSIAATQNVNLKVYKYDTGEPDLLLYNEQYNQVGGPADTAFPASKHHIADKDDFLGYLNAYQYKDHLNASGTAVVKGNLKEIEDDLRNKIAEGAELTAAKEVEVYGLSGQALRWATPAQYFLAKGLTPPWVRDSGPVPEPEEDLLPEEEPIETPEIPVEAPEENPEEPPVEEPGTDTPAPDEPQDPTETPEPDPEPEETPEPAPNPAPEETPDPEPDPVPAEDSGTDAPIEPSGEDTDGRTLAAYVEDGEISLASENGDAAPVDSAKDAAPSEGDGDGDPAPAPEETPDDTGDSDEPSAPAEGEDTIPNDTENTDPSDVTSPETPADPAPETPDETKPEEPAGPDKAPDETDLSRADEMYPGGEFYDLELMPEDFFLPPFPYQGEEENKPRKAARAVDPGSEGDGFIHNYFLWDGTIVTEDGAVESLESGTYMIAIEPLSPTSQDFSMIL